MEVVILARAKQGFIYKHMKERGLSVAGLAKRIGISYRTLSLIMNFQWPRTTRHTLYKSHNGTVARLEAYFNVSIDEIYPLWINESNLPGEKEISIDYNAVTLASAPEQYLEWRPRDVDHVVMDRATDRLPALLTTLRPREEKVLRLLFGVGCEAR